MDSETNTPRLLSSIVALGTLFFAVPAHALDVEAMLGAAWVDHNVGAHLTWGFMAHQDIEPYFNVGLYYQHFGNTVADLNPNLDPFSVSYNWIAAEANYKLVGFGIFDGIYFGVKTGLALTSTPQGNANTNVNVLFAPTVGYDVPIGSALTAGIQFNVLWTTGGLDGDPGQNYPTNSSLSNFNLFSVLKYSFN